MDQYKNPSIVKIATYLVLATTLLFFAFVSLRFAYENSSGSAFRNLAPSLLFITPSLIATIRIAVLLRRPPSDYQKGRPLWLTLSLSLGVVFFLAVLVFAVAFLTHD